MLERRNLYDFLSSLIPGTLLLVAAAVLLPDVKGPFQAAGLPDEFVVVTLLAGSMLAGQVTQTVGNMLEPPLFKAFGGGPSDRALAGTLGERYLPRDAADSFGAKLRGRLAPGASDRSLFLHAMNLAESAQDSKASVFNAQYGYLRSVFILLLSATILLAASRSVGAAAEWPCDQFWLATIGGATLAALFAWRAWQRGAYYAREVLLAAERHVGASAGSTSANRPCAPTPQPPISL